MSDRDDLMRHDRDRAMTAPAEPLPAPEERRDRRAEEAAEEARTRDPTAPTGDAG